MVRRSVTFRLISGRLLYRVRNTADASREQRTTMRGLKVCWSLRRSVPRARHRTVMNHYESPLRVIHLRVERLQNVPSHALARIWREAMLHAGLLTELPHTSDDPDDPRGWMVALQRLLAELDDVETTLASLRTRDVGMHFKDVPWWMWVGVLLQPLVAILFGMIMGDAESANRYWAALVVYGVPGALALGILGWAWLRTMRRSIARDRVVAEETERRDQVRRSLQEGCAALSERSFVARAGTCIVVSTVDYDWLMSAADDVRRVGDALLADQLAAEARTLDAQIRTALREPPDEWVSAGVLDDREDWSKRVQGVL